MKIWIVDSSTGTTFFYHQFGEIEVEVNEHLVSGLLAALNQFIMTQFEEPIESIDMGGARWIYVYDKEKEILCVAAETKEADPAVVKAQLEVLKLSFVHGYLLKNESWLNHQFDGDITYFESFIDVVEEHRAQWKKAELANVYAEFYDVLRIFHQIFILIKNTIDKQLTEKKREVVYDKLEDIFLIFKNKILVQKDEELKKVTFSREEGFDILTINPSKCNMEAVRKHITNLFILILKKLKQEIGYELSLKLFAKENVLSYIFSNLNLLKMLEIDKLLLETFMME